MFGLARGISYIRAHTHCLAGLKQLMARRLMMLMLTTFAAQSVRHIDGIGAMRNVYTFRSHARAYIYYSEPAWFRQYSRFYDDFCFVRWWLESVYSVVCTDDTKTGLISLLPDDVIWKRIKRTIVKCSYHQSPPRGPPCEIYTVRRWSRFGRHPKGMLRPEIGTERPLRCFTPAHKRKIMKIFQFGCFALARMHHIFIRFGNGTGRCEGIFFCRVLWCNKSVFVHAKQTNWQRQTMSQNGAMNKWRWRKGWEARCRGICAVRCCTACVCVYETVPYDIR